MLLAVVVLTFTKISLTKIASGGLKLDDSSTEVATVVRKRLLPVNIIVQCYSTSCAPRYKRTVSMVGPPTHPLALFLDFEYSPPPSVVKWVLDSAFLEQSLESTAVYTACRESAQVVLVARTTVLLRMMLR